MTIEAEGDPNQLEQFIRFVERGPQWARVDRIRQEELPAADDEHFTVK